MKQETKDGIGLIIIMIALFFIIAVIEGRTPWA